MEDVDLRKLMSCWENFLTDGNSWVIGGLVFVCGSKGFGEGCVECGLVIIGLMDEGAAITLDGVFVRELMVAAIWVACGVR